LSGLRAACVLPLHLGAWEALAFLLRIELPFLARNYKYRKYTQLMLLHHTSDAGFDALADKVALKLGKRSHY
jgi:hypothetical protein